MLYTLLLNFEVWYTEAIHITRQTDIHILNMSGKNTTWNFPFIQTGRGQSSGRYSLNPSACIFYINLLDAAYLARLVLDFAGLGLGSKILHHVCFGISNEDFEKKYCPTLSTLNWNYNLFIFSQTRFVAFKLFTQCWSKNSFQQWMSLLLLLSIQIIIIFTWLLFCSLNDFLRMFPNLGYNTSLDRLISSSFKCSKWGTQETDR